MKTILIATKLNGSEVLLAGSNVPYPLQREMRMKFESGISEEFSAVDLCTLTPHSKRIQLVTAKGKAEHDRALAAQEAAFNKATEAKSDAVAVKQSPVQPAKPNTTKTTK